MQKCVEIHARTTAKNGSEIVSWLDGYLFRQPIQIFHTRVVNTENNVPILVKLRNTNFDFASARADGFDVRFAMFDGTLLHFERERHDQAAQKAEYFVNVPTVHAGVDTFFYIYYGKSDAVDGQFPTLVWDANFKARWSLKENPAGSAPQIRNSTVNANHGTAFNMTSAQSVEGKIGRALDFDGVNDYVDVGNDASLDFGFPITLEAWVNPSSHPHFATIISRRPAVYQANYVIRTMGGRLEFYFRSGATWHVHRTATAIITLNEWQHVVAVYDGSNVKTYRNGVEVYSAAETAIPWTGVGNVEIGRITHGGSQLWHGLLDEVRISNIARSASWIALQYHSMNDTLLQFGNIETGIDLVDGAIANVIATCAETLQHDSRHSQATALAIANTTTLREILLQQHAIATPIATSVDVDWKLYVLMNDIDISEKIDDLDVSLAMSERSSCSFTFKSPTAPAIGENVEVRYSTIIIFSGTIEDISQEGNIFQTEYKFKIDCIDYTKILDRIIITKSYQNQDIGFIINDIFNSYLQQEILEIGILNTGREISRVTFNHITISEALDYLATQTNMRWNVNAYKRLNFMFFGAFHAPYSIHAASNLQSLVTKKNADGYYNRITIRGGEDIITNNIEEFQGDGHTKTFSTRIRINATPIITIDGISQSVGVGGETHSEQFFWNKNERTIFQNPAHAGFFGTMKVVYDGVRTISVTVDNTIEQARKRSVEGGSGVYEFVHYDQDIMTLSAAHALGTSMLEKYATEEVSVQFDTNETFLEGYPKLLEPGQRLSVNVPQHNINTDTIITDITITEFARQPKFDVSAVCGQNRDYRQFFKRMTAQGKVHIPIESERFNIPSSATVTAIATCAATASQSIDLTSVASVVPVAVAVASLETLCESQAIATAIATSAENRYIATEKTSVATATAVAHTNQTKTDGV